MVKIDSISFEEERVAEHVATRLGSLGLSVATDSSAPSTGSNTGNLVCTLSGDGRGRSILLAAHMDTVEPGRGIEPRIDGDVITSRGETVLGADDKAAVAITIELIERIVAEGRPHGRIDLLFTVAEEKGLVGAKHLDLAVLGRPDFAYVLDAEGPPGNIVVGAPYYDSVKAVFLGRAAHSGIEPEAGVNALSAAAEAITRVTVGRIDEVTTVNIGTIQGGRERNIIPDRVEINGEARSMDEGKLKAQVEAMTVALRSVETDGLRVEVDTAREFEGFTYGQRHPSVALASAAMKAAGIQPSFRVTGGGSDANILKAVGIEAVALSVGALKAHAVEERVHLSDMERSVSYLLEMVRMAASAEPGDEL